MPKYHYWTDVTQQDDDETSLSITSPLITLSDAPKRVDDTILRVIFWCSVAATVTATKPPPLDWLAGATCDYLVWFDTSGAGIPINITDDEPDTMGFVRMNLTMLHTPTANTYVALWQGPVEGLNLEGRHKGFDPFHVPAVSFQRWVLDNHGVFDNFASYSVQFSSRLVGRLLWASDQAPDA